MKMKKRFFFSGVLLCLLIALFCGWRLFHEGRLRVESQKTDAKIEASKLFEIFSNDEDSANELYLGKILEVEGRVSSKSINKNHVAIQLSAGDPMGGGINCALRFPKDSVTEVGQLIKVKGKCSGYLMDVNLTDVEIIN